MSKIMKTEDYSIFKKHQQNRPIDPMNLKKIKNSIKINNLLELRPILVNADMEIIDGQHRLEAARELGVEIYYQVEKNIAAQDMIRLNANQKNWTSMDYIDFYVSAGNVEYLRIKEFMQKNNITINEYIRMAIGMDGTKAFVRLRGGTLKFMSPEKEQETLVVLNNRKEVRRIIGQFALSFAKFTSRGRFSMALSNILQHPDLDLEVFKNKIKIKSDALRQCASTIAYYSMLKDIYNWRNQNPID